MSRVIRVYKQHLALGIGLTLQHYFSPKTSQTLGRLSGLTPELLSPLDTKLLSNLATEANYKLVTWALWVSVQASFFKVRGKDIWLIKTASLLVGEHSKCDTMNNSKQMYVKSVLCHCQPNPLTVSCFCSGHYTPLQCGIQSPTCLGLQKASVAWSQLRTSVKLA